MIIETCPKCGKDLFKLTICTYPPIPKWECECGWSYEGEPEKIVRVPFNADMIGKEIRPKELKGEHTDMVILNDLDDMLSEIALENKIADMRGKE